MIEGTTMLYLLLLIIMYILIYPVKCVCGVLIFSLEAICVRIPRSGVYIWVSLPQHRSIHLVDLVRQYS